MTAVAERPAPPAPGQVTAAGKPAGRRIDAVTILTIWVVLLMAIPASLVVAPLGAVGGPATIFAAVVLVFYLVTWLHPRLAPAKGRQPVRAAAILLTCAVIGTYVSSNRHIMPGLERNGIDRGIILICGWLGVLIMASDGIPSIERLKKLLGRVVIGATAMAAIGITQFFTGLDATQYIVIPGLKVQTLNTDLLSRNGLNRPSATAAHPLEFAAVLAMALPIAINRARFAPPGKRGVRWTQVGLIGAALPMTVSRSAVLAVLAVAFVLLPTWPKIERRIAYVVMALGVAGLWFLVPGLIGTFRTLFATLTGDTSTTSRTSAFTNAMPYISQHPWFGHGFGTFFPATYFYTDDQYLLSLIEIGVVGLVALLGLFVTGLVTAQRVRRATKDPEMRDLGQCLTATIAVGMVAFGTFDALSFNMAAGLTFLFLGCTGAALRLLKAQGAQADGHLAGQLAMQLDQGSAALTHRPRPDEPNGLDERGAAGELYGVAGLRDERQPNGPDERQPTEKSNGHLPPPGEQLERPSGPHQEERAGSQMEQLIGRYRGEPPVGQPEQQADGYLAEPAEGASEQRADAAREQPTEAAHQQPAEAPPKEPAPAQAERPASSDWDNHLWPWEPQDLQPRPREEEQPAETPEAEQPAQARQEEPAQAEQPAQAQVEQPEGQVEVPDLPAGRPTVQAEVPDLPAGRPTVQAEVPDLPAGLLRTQAERPAGQAEEPGARAPWAQAGKPAETQEERPAAWAEQPADVQTERPADPTWDPWRKPERPVSQPTAAAADEQPAAPIGQPAAEPAASQAERPAGAPWDPWRKPGQPTSSTPDERPFPDERAVADQQPAEPIGRPAAEAPAQQEPEPTDQPPPEPGGERPEESTIPIPIIQD